MVHRNKSPARHAMHIWMQLWRGRKTQLWQRCWTLIGCHHAFAAEKLKYFNSSSIWRAAKYVNAPAARARACCAANQILPRRKSNLAAPQIKFCCRFSRQQVVRQQTCNASLHLLWMGSCCAASFCIFWCERRADSSMRWQVDAMLTELLLAEN